MQLIYNDNGSSAGSEIYYDATTGNVGIGTSSPTSVLQLIGVQEYATNTAAIAAGLTPGAIYRTGDVLKIVRSLSGTEDNPGLSCKQILDSGSSIGNGLYWIDPDGTGGGSAFQVYCDMTTSSGGWTLIMKAIGDDFDYDDPLWEDTNVLNPTNFNFTTSPSKSKYNSFNTVSFSELRTSDTTDFTQGYTHNLGSTIANARTLFLGSGVQIGTSLLSYFNSRSPADSQQWGCTTYINAGINQREYLGTSSLPGGSYCDWNGGARFGQRVNASHGGTGNHAGQGWGNYTTVGYAFLDISQLLWVK